ncbi:L,D-transpeptidase family protein, partial [Mycobacterium avium]|uniref:L,D-transpeptidase family protein n=1 Tax=Mycobacterium avium TaxID=1764 RepID=UPI00373FE46C
MMIGCATPTVEPVLGTNVGGPNGGVPVNSTYGYKVTVEDAVRFDNVGDYVHSAPWSVDDQGKRDVSHGCINISPANAKW